MARHPSPTLQTVNLDDSDVTFFYPDIEKHPDEARCLDDVIDDDSLFERTYNKLGSTSRACTSPARHLLADSDKTFFEFTENFLPPEQRIQLPDSDETFFEVSGEAHLALQAPEGAGCLLDKDETYFEQDVLVGGRRCPALACPSDVVVKNEVPENVVADHVADTQSLFTHDLPWGQVCWEQDVQEEHFQGCHDNGDDELSSHDLYVELEDPLTQQMVVYRVPGAQACPDTMQLFTQDLGWTQTQPNEHGHDWIPTCTASPKELGLLTQTVTQDLVWPQTQSEELAMDVGSHSSSRRPAGSGGTASDPAMDTSSEGTVQHGLGQGVGTAPAASVAPAPPAADSSTESSEGQVVPSVPSFDDDLTLPLCLPWPLRPDDQFKIEDIVASLSNISFNLEAVADGGISPRVSHQAAPPDEQCDQLCLSSPPHPPTAPPSQPRSPTFCKASFGRRRGRPRASRAGPSSGVQGGKHSGPRVQCPGTGAKRKRLGAPDRSSQQQQRASQPTFTCSPSSPPRQRARRTGGDGASLRTKGLDGKGRTEMIAVYSRLQELRFHMQDILGGREPRPAAEEVAGMRREVLGIISSMEQADTGEAGRTKARLKKEQARQVADKLLHQLRVLAESHESQGIEEGCSESNTLTTSWSNPAAENPSQLLTPLEKAAEPNICPEETYFSSCPQTTQNTGTDNTQAKQTKEKQWKKEKRNTLRKKRVTSKQESRNDDLLEEENKNTIFGDPSVNSSNEIDVKKKIKESVTEIIDAQKDHICHRITNIEGIIEIPQSEVFSGFVQSDAPIENGAPTNTEAYFHFGESRLDDEHSDNKDNMDQDEQDPDQKEYQHIVGLIKSNVATTLRMQKTAVVQEDFVWRGGPLKLTGILLPKKSELVPINDLPLNFWEDPQSPIPEEWISLLEWED